MLRYLHTKMRPKDSCQTVRDALRKQYWVSSRRDVEPTAAVDAMNSTRIRILCRLQLRASSGKLPNQQAPQLQVRIYNPFIIYITVGILLLVVSCVNRLQIEWLIVTIHLKHDVRQVCQYFLLYFGDSSTIACPVNVTPNRHEMYS